MRLMLGLPPMIGALRGAEASPAVDVPSAFDVPSALDVPPALDLPISIGCTFGGARRAAGGGACAIDTRD